MTNHEAFALCVAINIEAPSSETNRFHERHLYTTDCCVTYHTDLAAYLFGTKSANALLVVAYFISILSMSKMHNEYEF